MKITWRPSPVLLRLAGALVFVGLMGGWLYPLGVQLTTEARDSKAVSKGRVLLRGAQIVATQQLVESNDWDVATCYLQSKTNLTEVLKAAKFPVEAVEIGNLVLDEQGKIETFDCVLDYDGYRYEVAMDVTKNTAQPTVLEKLTPAKTK